MGHEKRSNRYWVYNGELLTEDEYDAAEDDEGLYVEMVPASDYDAFLTERDALREAGDAMAAYLAEDPCPSDVGCELCAREQPLVAAWRAATGESA